MALKGIVLTLALTLAAPATALAADASVVTLLRQSQQAAARGQLDQAMDMVNQALSQDPAYPPLWNQKASLQIKGKDYAGAMQTLAVALKVEPENIETNVLALSALLRLDEKAGGKDPALARFVSGISDGTAGALITDLLTRPGAKADLRRFLAAWNPASPQGQSMARLAAGYASGDPAAMAELAGAEAQGPAKAVLGALQFYAGKDMLAEKKLAVAQKLLEQSGANGYDKVAVAGELGWVLYNQGHQTAAADLWEKDWRNAPDVGRWAAWIADARLASKDYKRAADFLEKSLQFDPNNAVLQGQNLLALTASGQAEAAEKFAASLADAPDQDGLNFGKALIALSGGRYGEAAENLARIKNRRPFRDQFIELANLMVTKLGQSGDSAKMVADLRALVEGMDIKPEIMRDVGWRMWAERRYDAALAFWKEALADGLGANDPLVARVVPLLIEQGRVGEAMAMLKSQAPEVSQLGLAWSLAAQNRWDLVAKLAPGLPAGPYADLLAAMAGLQNGQVSMALDKLRALAGLSAAGLGQAAVAGFNADGQPVKGALTPAIARELYLRISRTLAEQQILDGFFFLTPPAWAAGVAPKALAAVQAEAGKALWRAGRLAEASTMLTAALGADPSLNSARLYLALVKKRQGQTAEAQALLSQALAGASPFDRDYALGEFAYLDGNKAQALTHFQRCLALAPADDAMRLRVISLLAGENRFAEARQYAAWYDAQVAKGDRAVFGTAAVVRLELGDPAGAEALYRKLLAQNPNSLDYLGGLGRALSRQSRYAQTVAALGNAYAASADPTLGALLCEASSAQGDYPEAIRLAEVGLARSPKDRELLRLAAEAAEFAKDLPACEGYVRRVLELDPDSLTMQNMLGRVLLDQEKFPEAEEHFQAILAKNPRQLSALRGLLSVYQLSGKADKAYKVAKALREAAPDDASAQLKFAIAAAGDHAFRPAYPMLEKLHEFGPGSGVLCLYYADVRDAEAPGKVRLSQITDHIRAVAGVGGMFLGVEELAARPVGDAARKEKTGNTPPAVVLIVDRTDAAVLEKIDRELAAVGGKAVLVVGGESLAPGTPYLPDAALVARLRQTGRWSLALTDHNPPSVTAPGGGKMSLWYAAGAEAGEAGDAGARLKARLAALDPKGEILGQTRPVFFYPGGAAPEELLTGQSEAYQNVVAETFPMAFELGPEGFWTPVANPRQIGSKAVSPAMDAAALQTWLREADPMRQVSLELAKVYSWQEQTGQAENYFEEAASLGLNPSEVTFNRAVNAYYAYDDPTALHLAQQAMALAPDSLRAAEQLFRAELRVRPKAEAMATTWWDSDNRRYWWTGLGGNYHVRDDLMVFAKVGLVEWSIVSYQRRGYILKAYANAFENGEVSAEDLYDIANSRYTQSLGGQDVTVGGRWFFHPEYWLEVQGQLTTTDGGPSGWVNGQATVHGPIAPKGAKIDGTWEIQAAHERIDTVEAITDQIMANRLSVFTHTRILDFWDLFVNAHGISRTDGNNTGSIDGRLLRRLFEYPLFSLGYAFQFANSDRNPIQYWAPQDLATHLAYGSFGYAPSKWFNVNGSVGYGLSSDRNNSWREVWRANAGMDITMRDRLKLSLKYSYFSTPDYNLSEAWAGISYTF
ncbi:MAG TPA: tetratricopeptide repeat protein [Solidesulfovibrio magneticus]|nr:tetratricopeptide repeat protein [Solidesulfovibrio magneticus]